MRRGAFRRRRRGRGATNPSTWWRHGLAAFFGMLLSSFLVTTPLWLLILLFSLALAPAIITATLVRHIRPHGQLHAPTRLALLMLASSLATELLMVLPTSLVLFYSQSSLTFF